MVANVSNPRAPAEQSRGSSPNMAAGYCGNSINAGSVSAPVAECNMVCAGDPYEYCGAGNRLELYRLASAPTEGEMA